jgi:hypothetical protein
MGGLVLRYLQTMVAVLAQESELADKQPFEIDSYTSIVFAVKLEQIVESRLQYLQAARADIVAGRQMHFF